MHADALCPKHGNSQDFGQDCWHVRTDELGCFTGQKLDCVTSVMCWCTVLLEDKYITSNAADHWQQFLYQQHVNW